LSPLEGSKRAPLRQRPPIKKRLPPYVQRRHWTIGTFSLIGGRLNDHRGTAGQRGRGSRAALGGSVVTFSSTSTVVSNAVDLSVSPWMGSGWRTSLRRLETPMSREEVIDLAWVWPRASPAPKRANRAQSGHVGPKQTWGGPRARGSPAHLVRLRLISGTRAGGSTKRFG